MLNPDFEKSDLIPAVVQDKESARVLMLAYMNKTSFDLTIETGFAHFWSRSRNEIWKKGSTSGNTLRVLSVELDCDSDAILLSVHAAGPCCHTGLNSCFDTAHQEIGEGE